MKIQSVYFELAELRVGIQNEMESNRNFAMHLHCSRFDTKKRIRYFVGSCEICYLIYFRWAILPEPRANNEPFWFLHLSIWFLPIFNWINQQFSVPCPNTFSLSFWIYLFCIDSIWGRKKLHSIRSICMQHKHVPSFIYIWIRKF